MKRTPSVWLAAVLLALVVALELVSILSILTGHQGTGISFFGEAIVASYGFWVYSRPWRKL